MSGDLRPEVAVELARSSAYRTGKAAAWDDLAEMLKVLRKNASRYDDTRCVDELFLWLQDQRTALYDGRDRVPA